MDWTVFPIHRKISKFILEWKMLFDGYSFIFLKSSYHWYIYFSCFSFYDNIPINRTIIIVVINHILFTIFSIFSIAYFSNIGTINMWINSHKWIDGLVKQWFKQLHPFMPGYARETISRGSQLSISVKMTDLDLFSWARLKRFVFV